jgi:hypothetical protein
MLPGEIADLPLQGQTGLLTSVIEQVKIKLQEGCYVQIQADNPHMAAS